ncbi:hypothetical protein HELRODRAFT_173955 [Helobdella robusta]|uniref:Uncharacterized protein n=1 Tax=Helobdella robusta TaxID=6412 RepID=T1F7E8_HELRO|nr:hypothetical protein HELRODRAFT_173955 [Helobdella robusta]ESO03075.1 hypothetical protein HELRODRAFT_173955 [Helobdella robusta]
MAALLNEILDRNKTCTNLISSIAHETNSRTNLATCNVYDTNVNRIKNETIDTSWSNILVSKTNKTDCELQSDDNVSDDRMTLVQRSKKNVKSISLPPIAKKVEDDINKNKFHKPSKILGSLTTSPLFTASI